jgi:hypothetical protein
MTTVNDNDLDERITALIESYAEAANWRAIGDDVIEPAFGFAYDRHRVEVSFSAAVAGAGPSSLETTG